MRRATQLQEAPRLSSLDPSVSSSHPGYEPKTETDGVRPALLSLEDHAGDIVDGWFDRAADAAAMLCRRGGLPGEQDGTGHDALDWIQVGLRLCSERARTIEL